MGVSTGSPCCGGGCQSGYDDNFLDDFEGSEFPDLTGWFFVNPSYFINTLGRFAPIAFKPAGVGGLTKIVTAFRYFAIDLNSVTEVNLSAIFYRPALAFGDQEIFFDNPFECRITGYQSGSYGYRINDLDGIRTGSLSSSPADGDKVEIDLDIDPATVGPDPETDPEVTWNLNLRINGSAELTTTLRARQYLANGSNNPQHCNTTGGLEVEFTEPTAGDPGLLRFDDFEFITR